ncbi:MAG TPA: JAB domain-containing protein [Chitinophagales bacterium]|nr:JAB domain-containing protein [Chitinophagales bacterium]
MREKRMLQEAQVSFKPGYDLDELEVLRTSNECASFFRSIWEDDLMYRERMYMILLNRASKVIGFNLLSIGGASGTIVDLKLVFQCAILTNASAIVLAHNHPSGTLYPSNSDIEITKRVKRAGDVMEIELVDHIILTQNSFYSFADHSLLNNF